MFGRDIGIDLGTVNVLIYDRHRGMVLNEPSVVAMNTATQEVLYVGEDALRLVGRTSENIYAIRPLCDGVISNFEITESMLKHFMLKIGAKRLFFRPRVLICCPSNITLLEKRAIKETAERIGARQVYVEEEIKAAAIGAGIPIFQTSGHMVMDIGGGTTDAAVLSMGEIVIASSITTAGNQFDSCITTYIKDKHRLLIGEQTAEEIKIRIGSVIPHARNESMVVRGRDLVTGMPKAITISTHELESSLGRLADDIVQAAKSVLEKTPPELACDILDEGICLTGGGALLYGLDRLLQEELKMPVFIADEPKLCVAKGIGILLSDSQYRLHFRNII